MVVDHDCWFITSSSTPVWSTTVLSIYSSFIYYHFVYSTFLLLFAILSHTLLKFNVLWNITSLQLSKSYTITKCINICSSKEYSLLKNFSWIVFSLFSFCLVGATTPLASSRSEDTSVAVISYDVSWCSWRSTSKTSTKACKTLVNQI